MQLISPHYGMVPQFYTETYWEIYEEKLDEEQAFINELYRQNLTENEMMQRFADKYWAAERAQEQPLEAFLLNAKNTIKAAKKG
jgi:2-aminobenzoylacetyl-CoA thioesterase